MKPLGMRSSCALVVLLCTGCPLHKNPPPQAQAPPLQTGNGTLNAPKTTQPQETLPLASPLPQPSAQSVPLPPPPPPKKVRHRVKTPKPVDTTQTAAVAAATPAGASTETVAAPTASPIGQLTIGDSALGERTKHETAELIGSTVQGVNGIKRTLSPEEKVTAAQIHTFLKQAQQALDSGDTDGGYKLATKAKLLLDELTKP